MTFLGFFFFTSWSILPPWHLFSHDSLVYEKHLLYRHCKPLQNMLKIRFLIRLGNTIVSFIYHWQPSVMWWQWNKNSFLWESAAVSSFSIVKFGSLKIINNAPWTGHTFRCSPVGIHFVFSFPSLCHRWAQIIFTLWWVIVAPMP